MVKKKNYRREVKGGRLPRLCYKKPKITRVKLDPRQAMLAVCKQASGVWMSAGGIACIYEDGPPNHHKCAADWRGIRVYGQRFVSDEDTAGS